MNWRELKKKAEAIALGSDRVFFGLTVSWLSWLFSQKGEENKKYIPCPPFFMKTTTVIFLLLANDLREQIYYVIKGLHT